jgi:hypothetical protein
MAEASAGIQESNLNPTITKPEKMSILDRIKSLGKRMHLGGAKKPEVEKPSINNQIEAEKAKIQASRDLLSQISMDPTRADSNISNAEKASIVTAEKNITDLQIKNGTPMRGTPTYERPWTKPNEVTTIPLAGNETIPVQEQEAA